MKKLVYFFISLIIILLIFFSFILFIKVNLSDGYYIKSNLFFENCCLYTKDNKLILTNIGEWIDSEEYIYGYGDGKIYKCYIFEKNKKEVEIFFSTDDFYDILNENNLKYNMSDTKDLNFYD